MTADRAERFPLGAAITLAELEGSPYAILARLQAEEPVTWVPALGAWLVTGREQVIEAMRDADRLTVDDPRFSTAAVMGQSMLSLDGPEHERHRSAFAEHFRPKLVRDRAEERLGELARSLVRQAKTTNAGADAAAGSIELRSQLAGPLAVEAITEFLDLVDTSPDEVLGWYYHIADAIVGVSTGAAVAPEATAAIAAIQARVRATLAEGGHESLLTTVQASGRLRPEEVAPATAVVMFGAIETSEAMTANALWHLFGHPETMAAVRTDRTLVAPAIEESLRLEPAAAVIDRYATADIELTALGRDPVTIPERELVTLSLLAANRDPDVFPDPGRYDITRPNLRQHVTFVQGPHACLGLHLARLETVAAVDAVLDELPDAVLDVEATTAPAGLIFRKPAAITVRWN